MIEIPLNNSNKVALVDDEYESLLENIWRILIAGSPTRAKEYAVSSHCLMHRLIMKPSKGYEVDHRDHNGLNNVKSNLRLCTKSQNMMNKRPSINGSGFKGINWNKRDQKWHARIAIMGKQISLGYYDSKQEAALAYNKEAIKLFGDFAYLNIIE